MSPKVSCTALAEEINLGRGNNEFYVKEYSPAIKNQIESCFEVLDSNEAFSINSDSGAFRITNYSGHVKFDDNFDPSIRREPGIYEFIGLVIFLCMLLGAPISLISYSISKYIFDKKLL